MRCKVATRRGDDWHPDTGRPGRKRGNKGRQGNLKTRATRSKSASRRPRQEPLNSQKEQPERPGPPRPRQGIQARAPSLIERNWPRVMWEGQERSTLIAQMRPWMTRVAQ